MTARKTQVRGVGFAPWTFNLPWPVSVNAMYANVAGRGRVTSARYLTWKRAALNSLRGQRLPHAPLSCAVKITLELDASHRKGRIDASNFIKGVEDFLCIKTAAVIVDDSQVDEVTVRWAHGISGARVTVTPADVLAV